MHIHLVYIICFLTAKKGWFYAYSMLLCHLLEPPKLPLTQHKIWVQSPQKTHTQPRMRFSVIGSVFDDWTLPMAHGHEILKKGGCFFFWVCVVVQNYFMSSNNVITASFGSEMGFMTRYIVPRKGYLPEIYDSNVVPIPQVWMAFLQGNNRWGW